MSSATGREPTAQYAVIADDAASAAMTDPLQILRRTLRGRYPLVVLLALVLGALGALAGYRVLPPNFESTGMLRVEATLPSILYDTRENSAPPNFDAFVAAQAMLVRSRQVLDAAVADESLRTAGWRSSSRPCRSIDVEASRSSSCPSRITIPRWPRRRSTP
jgi:uncharacterized protein involved in exopolysaccharide biosynthesis